MPNVLPLSHYVSVRNRFTRSVHLERDYHNRKADEYYLTETAYSVMKAMEAALINPAQRALTLTGPYGTGKSALCVHLAQLMAGSSEGTQAAIALKQADADLSRSLTAKKLIPVLTVGSRQPLAKSLVQGLMKSLDEGEYTTLATLLEAEFSEVLRSTNPSARSVVELYRRAAQMAKSEGAQGVLLIADELGKFFEYAALNPKQGDIFLLQELAEAAARSGEHPLIVIGVLHQNAEAYAQKLGRTYQAEWAKVSERFRQINFFPSDSERLEMVGHALKQTEDLRLNQGFSVLSRDCIRLDLVSSIVKESFETKAQNAYPLHPVCLLALPALFRRMGQSHRSLFSFLTGEEPHALGRFLRETPYTAGEPPLFMVESLFDYTGDSLAGSWSASQLARTWAEAVELIESAADLSITAQRVLKCIGLLGILRDAKLMPTRDVLKLAVSDCRSQVPDVDAALKELVEKKRIVFSRTRNCYRLFQGGDVDIEAEMEAVKSGLPSQLALQVAAELCPPPRLIARRHSYRTGALRTVQSLFCRGDELEKVIAESGDTLTLLYCLTTGVEETERTEKQLQTVPKPNLLIALATESQTLHEVAADVLAANKVEIDCRALDHDGAARRELSFQRGEAETLFQKEWERLFNVSDGGETVWRYQGQVVEFHSTKQFSVFLSEMADRTYSASPLLKNELINRHALSSAAASGRRNLIEGMLLHADTPQLGIKGAPPELSMYECLLRVTGIHREIEPGKWDWSAPDETNPANLLPVWKEIEGRIFADPPSPQPVHLLFETLKSPPFGMTEGVLPVLLAAFMQVYAAETTLYKEGTFLPQPGVPDWEVLMRRPELFAVAGCRVTGERAAVVERLSQGLKTESAVTPTVRALIRMVSSLPEFTKKTKRLPDEVIALRTAFDKAKSPERLLFYDLPSAVGATLMADEEVSAANVETFFQSLNTALRTLSLALPTTVAEARDTLLTACGLPVGEEGFERLRREAERLHQQPLSPLVSPFILRASASGNASTVLESVLALVANRPPRTWTDREVEQFPALARQAGRLFREAQTDSWHSLPAEQPQALSDQEQLIVRLRSQMESLSKEARKATLLALLEELNREE